MSCGPRHCFFFAISPSASLYLCDSLSTYEQKREAYATDLEQYHDLIRQMLDQKSDLETIVAQRKLELTKTNEQLAEMAKTIEGLKQTVSTQELSLNDLVKMESESKGISEAMDRLQRVKQERLTALQQSEANLVKYMSICKESIENYNFKIASLAEYTDLYTRISFMKAALKEDNLMEAEQKKILGIDIKSNAVPVIDESASSVAEKTADIKLNFQDALDQLENSLKEKNEAMNKKRIVEDKILKCEETLRDERKSHEAKLEVRQREVDAMEQKVANLRDPVPLELQMATYERQLAELESIRNQHQMDNIAKKKAVQDKLTQAYHIMLQHDEYFMRKLTEVEQHRETLKAQAETVHVPANLLEK